MGRFATHKGREVRVMATAEGWAMVRRKGATPFVVRDKELTPSFSPEAVAKAWSPVTRYRPDLPPEQNP